jgi:hypothetical protein
MLLFSSQQAVFHCNTHVSLLLKLSIPRYSFYTITIHQLATKQFDNQY